MLHEAQYSTRHRAGMVQGMTTSTFPQHDDENLLSAWWRYEWGHNLIATRRRAVFKCMVEICIYSWLILLKIIHINILSETENSFFMNCVVSYERNPFEHLIIIFIFKAKYSWLHWLKITQFNNASARQRTDFL